ncbi:MAG: tetratricopeptide repeat protein [Gemmatimonadaceae bacterium]
MERSAVFEPAAEARAVEEPVPAIESVAALVDRGQEYERRGQRPAARDAYARAVERADAEGEAARKVAILRWIARTHQVDAEYERALEVLTSAEDLALRIDDRVGYGHCLNLRAIISWQRGDLDEATRQYNVALDVAREVSDAHLAAITAQNLGIVASARGDFEQALHYYRASIAAYQSLGVPRDIYVAQNNLGRLHLEKGDWDEAEHAFHDAFTLAQSVGDSSVCTMVEVNIAEMWVRRGELDKARETCDRAMARAATDGDSSADAEAHKTYGVIALARGDRADAERHFELADTIAARREDLLLRAQIARERVELYRGQGRNRELLQALNGAHKLFTQLRARQAVAEVAAQTERLERDVLDVVRRWGESIEEKDQYTQGHCIRVADLACALARRAGLDDKVLFWFRVGALLHDVGKIVISPEILNKPGKLTADEWAVMKVHPGAGADILKDIDFPYDVIPIVKSHHENWDGTGYPDGLAGEQIPLWARMVCLADVYDALTSERSYKRALAHEEAIEVMRRDVRRQFDPALFQLFEEISRDAPPRRTEAPVVRAARPRERESQSATDELTGLVLRRGFLAQAQAALAEAAESGGSLSLAVIDVDHFKLVNDNFGHLQGDDVLRAVAVQLRDGVRRLDIVGRYAGDEFVVLFPNTSLEEARQLADRLRENVANMRLAIRERREGTIGVSLSIGVVTGRRRRRGVHVRRRRLVRPLRAAAPRPVTRWPAPTKPRARHTSPPCSSIASSVACANCVTLLGRSNARAPASSRGWSPSSVHGIGKTTRPSAPSEVRWRGGAMVAGRCLATDEAAVRRVSRDTEAIHALHLVPTHEWRELSRLCRATSAPPSEATASSTCAARRAGSTTSRQAPCAMLLYDRPDDIQWADSSTWDALEYAAQPEHPERLLICMTLRSEDAGAIVERRRHLSRDERFSDLLHRFTEDELRTWLETILHQGDIDRDFVRFIHGYTEGNPLLVVHVLRSLHEDGGLWYAGRRWQWKDAPELRLPTAVADLIGSRIDRMSEAARQRLAVAAVIGRAFDLDIVMAAGDVSEDELLDAVDEGIAAHVVEAIGGKDTDRYAFSHGLIADTIRRGIHRRRLTRMHGQVARALETLRPNAVAEIAAHYDAAGNGDKAFEFAMRAAERAVGVYAHDEAAASFAMAERHAPTVEDRLTCRFRRTQALELAGQYEAAEALCDLIIAERVSLGGRDPLLAVRRMRERLRSQRGQSLEQTAAAVEQLLIEAAETGDRREEVELLGMLSRVYLRKGNPIEARRLARQSVEVAEQIDDPGMLANTLMHLGSAVISTEPAEGLACYQRALAVFESLGDLVGQSRAQINIGIGHSRNGANVESAHAYQTALDLGRKIHSPDLTGLAALNLGVLHMKMGRFDESDTCFSEAMERFALLHNEPHRLAALYNQANLAIELDQHERAARLYGDAAVVATAMNQLDVELGARAGQGWPSWRSVA